MQNSNMVMSIFVFYYQKKGIPSENPFLFRKELYVVKGYIVSPLVAVAAVRSKTVVLFLLCPPP